ncbi:MAG TPA: FtsX-like permease family protein [Flavobacterium sp.]|nr:FtsX-like permease family protein [Flavobacterium sp.]
MKIILDFIIVNISYFIAKRLAVSKKYKSNVSAPIIKIAIVAVAISIVMMLVAVATGVGLQHVIRDKVSAFGGQIVVAPFDNNDSGITTESFSLDNNLIDKITSNQEVKSIFPIATKAGIIRTEKTFEGILYKGVAADYDFSQIQSYLIEGKTPDFGEKMSNQIVISQYLANRLEVEIGDKLSTYFLKNNQQSAPNARGFEVVGIYRSDFKEFDQTYVIGDLRQVQRLNKWTDDEVGAYEINLYNIEQLESTTMQIYEMLPSAINATAISDQFYDIFSWMELFDFNMQIIIGIMIIVSVINMIVALLVLILERSQMIGILKALGADNWTIRKTFLYSATRIVLRGLFWGNLIGVGLLLIQKYFNIIKLDASQYYVEYAPVYFNIWVILAINLAVVVICYLVLIIPSYLVAKISPVKVIKFQ